MTEATFVLRAKDEASPVFRKVKYEAAELETRVNAIRFGAFGLAIGAIGGYVGSAVRSAIDAGDQLNKLSQKVGVSVEKLSELRFAAELSDVSLEQFQIGMKGLNETLVRAQDATSKEAALLRTLGITAKDPYEALRQLADVFRVLPDGAEKTALAVDVLGKAGLALIPMMNGGAAAIDEAGRSARNLGLSFGAEFARKSEEFNDNMRKLTKSTEALGIALSGKLINSLAGVTGQLVRAKEEGRLFDEIVDNMRRSVSRLMGDLAKGDPGFLRNLFSGAAGVDKAEEMNRRTATGRIRGLPTEPPVPANLEERLVCIRSGGTWDEKANRCIPRPVSASPRQGMTAKDLFAANALKREEMQDERDLAADQEFRDSERQRLLDAQRLSDQMRDQAKAFREVLDPAQRYREMLFQVNSLEVAGMLNTNEATELRRVFSKEAERASMVLERFNVEQERTNSLSRDLGLTMSSAFERAVLDGEKLRDVIKGLGRDLAQIVLRRSVTEPLGDAISKAIGGGSGGGSSGGVLSSLRNVFSDPVDSIKRLLGFAHGGSFMVGGGGGIDSQVVAFRATPGERVSVQTPGQQRNAGGITVINQFVDVTAEIQRQIAYATPRIVDASVGRVADLRRRGVPV